VCTNIHKGVGAGKLLGVQTIFAQISPNVPEKNSKENYLQKKGKRLHFISCWAHFFNVFALTSPKFPQLARKELYKNMISKLNKKKRLHFDFGCHFCKIKARTAILRRFSHILPKFPQILPRF